MRKGVILSVGAEAVVDFSLQAADIQTEVVVDENAPIVEIVSPTTGANLDRNPIAMLPTISRNCTDFLRVISGTTSTSQGISIYGARAVSNNWQVDGLDNTDDSLGGQRLSPQIDIIAEFQVLTNRRICRVGPSSRICEPPRPTRRASTRWRWRSPAGSAKRGAKPWPPNWRGSPDFRLAKSTVASCW
jgi:hypothetical protein